MNDIADAITLLRRHLDQACISDSCALMGFGMGHPPETPAISPE